MKFVMFSFNAIVMGHKGHLLNHQGTLSIFKGGWHHQVQCFIQKFNNYITNLTCDELIMKIMQNLFIHRLVHFTHKYHVLKTRLMHG
jgi:hypothetical protein